MASAIITIVAQTIITGTPISAPPAPPSPPIVVSRSEYFPQSGWSQDTKVERYSIDVDVRAGNDVLWSGAMTVSSVQGASFTRRLTEPSDANCAPNAFGQQVENNLTVQLNPQRRADAQRALGVSVRWGRSVPGKCPYRNSVRNVELDETIALAEGQTVNLSGDGGLTIRLHRR